MPSYYCQAEQCHARGISSDFFCAAHFEIKLQKLNGMKLTGDAKGKQYTETLPYCNLAYLPSFQ